MVRRFLLALTLACATYGGPMALRGGECDWSRDDLSVSGQACISDTNSFASTTLTKTSGAARRSQSKPPKASALVHTRVRHAGMAASNANGSGNTLSSPRGFSPSSLRRMGARSRKSADSPPKSVP